LSFPLDSPEAVAAVVREGRSTMDLTQAELADKAGVGRKFVVSLEAGHPRAELSKVLNVLAALDIEAMTRRWSSPAAANPPGTRIYRLRPEWRPRYQPDVYVPADMKLLTGPTSGSLKPPVNLYWQPGEIDFSDRAAIRAFYGSALTSANTPEHFAWINSTELEAVWNQLSLPDRVRAAWETIHPELREENDQVNDRIRIQDTILTVIAAHGFALAGGSALIDYAVITRDSEDIDAFNSRMEVAAFDAAHAAILSTCEQAGWIATTTIHEDFRRQIAVNAGTGTPVSVDVVYYAGSGTAPERRAGGGLRLVFADVVGGKAAAIADAPRGRDFDEEGFDPTFSHRLLDDQI
jgi:y4mF family transcriptional regulator